MDDRLRLLYFIFISPQLIMLKSDMMNLYFKRMFEHAGENLENGEMEIEIIIDLIVELTMEANGYK